MQQRTKEMESLNQLADRAHSYAVGRGFWNGLSVYDVTVQLSKLALIHSEVSEAVEAVRKPNEVESNLPEELADIIIRVLDLAGAMRINIDQAVSDKMAYNEQREYMHGKRA